MRFLRRSAVAAAGSWIFLSTAVSPAEARQAAPEKFHTAIERAALASECFLRARGVLDGWWALRDPVTGLIPRRVDDPRWAPADNAADCFPFLVLSARFTRPERLDGLREMMRREVELTTRLGWLPDWYSIPRRRFHHAEPDLGRILFGAAEYAKDGLNPLIELDGLWPWSARLRQLLDGIMEHAQVESDFGPLPAADTETNGELLQSLARFYFATGEGRYLAFAERIGDAYCLEVLPKSGWLPAHQWDFAEHRAIRDELNLNDHGNEIVGGLVELFVAAQEERRESARRYEKPLRRMFDTLLEKARNEDGLWYGRMRPSTGEVISEGTPDTWGYALSAALAFGIAVGEERYIEAAREALRGVEKERYLEWRGADAYADSIEGALLLLNRLPEPAGFRWLEEIMPRFFAYQKLPRDGGTGIVEGWYGDGNYARTALMVALWATQGTYVQPWSEAVRLGAELRDEALHVALAASEDWSGRLYFDHPRHRDHFGLPWDYPRLNQYPEWFTVEAGELYVLRTIAGEGAEERRVLGLELLAGLPIELGAGEERFLTVELAGAPPFGEERGPADPWKHVEETVGDEALVASVDLSGDGEYAGETYRWTKDAPIEWTVEREGGPIDGTLWLRWGSKNDLREGRLTVGPRAVELEDGGWDGFSWLAVDVPASWWDGDRLVVRLDPPPAGRKAAFLSSMRFRATRFARRSDSPCWIDDATDFAGSWREQTNIPGFRGGGFRTSNASGIAADSLRIEGQRRLQFPDGIELYKETVYELDIAPHPAGVLYVWARGYEGDGHDRRFEVAFGGHRFEPTHRGKWSGEFTWQLAGHVELEEGYHPIEVHDAGPGYEAFDAVLVTADPFFDPGARERVSRAVLEPPEPLDFLGEVIDECADRAGESHRRIAERQTDLASWSAERLRLRGRLLEALGLEPLPSRTPLNARTVGVLERDGYRVERVVFESRPGFPVTANLYLPEGDPGERRPAVLCPTGHWTLAKTEPEVQSRCIGLAKRGYVALTYDPFGQGERDVDGNDHHEYFRSILVGRNNMSFMVWDTIRALDYLLERPEVDPERIACTGCSGGGLNTLYAAAVDERIEVAVPVVYVSTLEEFLGTRHSHCPCSHVNGLAAFADMGDVLALNAPRPTLLLTASRDPSFTPAGARGAAEQARGAFELHGAPRALEVREFDAEHGYDRAMREALYGWLALHLEGEGTGEPIDEPEIAVEEELSVLHCFESGRVPPEARTVRDLCRERARELAAYDWLDRRALRHRVVPSLFAPSLAAARMEPIDAGLLSLHRQLDPEDPLTPVAFRPSSGPPIRGWRRRGAESSGPLTVLVLEGAEPAALEPRIDAHVASSDELVLIDLRWLRDETEEHVAATAAHLGGDPLLFRYARALGEILLRLLEEAGGHRELIVIADGDRPSLALLLAQVATGAADAIHVPGSGSLADRFDAPLPPPDAFAWRLLELADLPELRAAVAESPRSPR